MATQDEEPARWLSPPVIILDRPAHGGNVGACARAMKNMGLTELRLVAPQRFPHPEADEFATGAVDLLEKALVFNTIAEAVADVDLLVAATSRGRGQRQTVVTPRQLGENLAAMPADSSLRVGILFGPERSGLETRDVEMANLILDIPTSPGFRSLNLSQAVLIVAYEILMARKGDYRSLRRDPRFETDLAPVRELELLFAHMESVLTEINFIQPKQERHMMGSLRAVFHRAALDSREVRILRGLLKEIIDSRGRLMKSLKGAKGEVPADDV